MLMDADNNFWFDCIVLCCAALRCISLPAAWLFFDFIFLSPAFILFAWSYGTNQTINWLPNQMYCCVHEHSASMSKSLGTEEKVANYSHSKGRHNFSTRWFSMTKIHHLVLVDVVAVACLFFSRQNSWSLNKDENMKQITIKFFLWQIFLRTQSLCSISSLI